MQDEFEIILCVNSDTLRESSRPKNETTSHIIFPVINDSMSIEVPIQVIAGDLAITKPFPSVIIGNPWKAPSLGPRIGGNGASSMNPWGPRIENFNPPVYLPDPTTIGTGYVYANAGNSIPQRCPQTPILYRNEFESMNTTNAKAFGGFDPYSIRNIPSCSERGGDYMNFMDTTRPMATAMVKTYEDYPIIRGPHGE